MQRFGISSVLLAIATSTAAAAPVERKVVPSYTTASSWKDNDWKSFHEAGHPSYAADGDPATAWIENGATSGGGEWIRYAFVALDKTTKVKVVLKTGQQKDAKAFAAAPRAKTITVKLLPSNTKVDATLQDKLGSQEVTLEQPAGPLTGVEVAIKDVYEGNDPKAKDAKDLAVSDLEVYATSDTPAAPAFEAAHAAQLKQWRAGRAAGAKKNATKTGVPVYAGYTVRVKDFAAPKTLGLEAMIAMAEADAALGKDLKYALVQAKQAVAAFDKIQQVALTAKNADVSPAADGIQIPTLQTIADADFDPTTVRLPLDGTHAIMFTPELALADSKDKTTPATFMTETGPCKAAQRAWVVKGDSTEMTGPQVPRVIVLGRCGKVQTRDGKAIDFRTREIYVYNPDNAAAIVIGENHVEGYRWGLDHGHAMIRGARSLIAPQGKALDINLRDDE